MRLPLLPLLALALFAASPVMAQIPTQVEPLAVSVSPQHPRPYDTVTVTPTSYLLDLASSVITVTANGTVVLPGSGRSVAVKMGGPGSRTTIRVTAVKDGASYEKVVVLTPAEVALIIEASSTVPPFYDGAALVAPQGQVRLVALPDFRTSAGTRVAASNLSYTWMLGEQLLNEQSGIGRSTLTATAPVRYRDAEVSVTVATTDGSMRARAVAYVAPSSPLVRVYETDPLLGTDFARAISEAFPLQNDEATFEAVPFFFARNPEIAWTLDGKAAGAESKLIVRTTGTSQGQAAARVTATAGGGEAAQGSFTIGFGASRAGTIFGF